MHLDAHSIAFFFEHDVHRWCRDFSGRPGETHEPLHALICRLSLRLFVAHILILNFANNGCDESFQIFGGAAGDHAIIHHDILVEPDTAGIFNIGSQ